MNLSLNSSAKSGRDYQLVVTAECTRCGYVVAIDASFELYPITAFPTVERVMSEHFAFAHTDGSVN